MPRVQNPNASGLTTVSTDGVTIQGNGTVGSPVAIKAVQVDGVTITGAGTVASPLAAAAQSPTGWPLQYFNLPGAQATSANTLVGSANTMKLKGLVLPAAVQFNKIIVNIAVGDAVNNYDFGFYTYAGALAAHVGAQHLPSTGLLSFTVVGGPITLNAGRYFFASTGVATTATWLSFLASGGFYSFQSTINFGTSVGGALPSSITPPADSITDAIIAAFALSI